MSNAIRRSAVTEIIKLHTQLGGLVRKSVITVWQLGQKLQEVKDSLDHGQFGPWFEENLGSIMSVRTTRHYMAVFNRYPHGVPEDITLTEAYVNAGVKKLAAPEAEDEPAPLPVKSRPQFEAKAIENMMVVGDVPLKYYRVAVGNGTVWGFHKGAPGMSIPIAELQIRANPGTEEAYQKYERMLQIITEQYLADIEDLEDRGITRPPVDPSAKARVARMLKNEETRKPEKETRSKRRSA